MDPQIDGRPAGAQEMQRALDLGGDPEQVHQYYAGQIKKAIDLGGNAKDVMAYYGWDNPKPDISPAADHVTSGLSSVPPEKQAQIASSPIDALMAGLQMSSTGLLAHGKPTMEMPKNPSTFQNIMSAFGSTVGDLPETIAGYAAGGYAGAAAGGLAGPGGAAIGAMAGGGAGSAALPVAMRTALNEIYQKNPRASFKDIFAQMANVTWSNVAKEAGKAALGGAVGGAIGGAAESLVAGVGKPLLGAAAAAIGGKAANAVGFGMAAQGVSDWLEGKIPEMKDYFTAAALGLGFSAAHAVVGVGKGTPGERLATTPAGDEMVSALKDAYVTTGQHPIDLAKVAANDVGVREELMAPKAADGTRVQPQLDEMKLSEPDPYVEAYHGSRHDFTEFSTDKIGTGEGAQAFGHGLYFAQNKGIADYYKTAGADPSPDGPLYSFQGEGHKTADTIADKFGPEYSDEWYAAKTAVQIMGMHGMDPNAARTQLERLQKADAQEAKDYRSGKNDNQFAKERTKDGTYIKDMDPASEAYKEAVEPLREKEAEIFENEVEHHNRAIDWIEKNGQDLTHPGGKGNLYNVKINAGIGHDLLNWDEPLEEQSDRVRAQFAKVKGLEPPNPGETIGEWHDRVGDPKDIADKLSAAGIKGFHYLDAASRDDATEERTHNMVIFDGKHVTVTHKNGVEIVEPHSFEERVASTELAMQGDDGSWEPPPATVAEIIPPGGGGKPPEEPPEQLRLPGPGEAPDPALVKNAAYRERVALEFIAGKAEKPGILTRFGGSIRQFIATFQSELTHWRNLDQKFSITGERTAAGQIKAPHDLGLEDTARLMLGSRSIANHFLRYGPLKLGDGKYERVDGPSFQDAFNAVKEAGGTTEGFYAYRMMARTVEKALQGVETGLDLGMSAEHVTDPAMRAKYERGTQMIRAAKDAAVDFYVDSGMLSKERGEAMKDLNEYHLVFNRAIDPSYIGMGKTRTSQVKKMTGSKIQITDPAQAEIDNLHSMIGNANRNRAFGSLVAFAELHNAHDALQLRKLGYPELGVDLSDIRLLEGDLRDEKGNAISGPAKDAAAPMLAQRIFNGVRKPGDFLIYRDGKPEVWHSDDPDIIAITEQQQQSFNPNVLHQALLGAMRITSNIAKLGVRLDPTFWVRSLSHAEFGNFVAGNGTFPFKEVFSGLHDSIADMLGSDKFLSNTFKDFRAQGGGISLQDAEHDFMKANQMDFLREQTSLTKRVWNSSFNPAQWPLIIGHVVHTAAQYGNYKANLKSGSSLQKAYNQSTTNLLDFREKFGNAAVQEYSRGIPFLNVAIKDIEQFGRAFQDNKVGTIARGIAALTIPTMTLAIANYSQDNFLPQRERYSEIPQYIKDGYYIMPAIPKGDGTYFRLKWPKPYVLNYLFATPAENFVAQAFGKGGGAVAALQSMVQTFMPPAVPAVLQPVAEQATNTKIVSGTPLISTSMEAASGYMQYGPNTSPEAVALAKLVAAPHPYAPQVNVSPVVLDNYFKEWGGSLPYEIARTVNGAFGHVPPGEQGWFHDYVSKTFLMTHQDYTPNTVEKAYEIVKQFQQAEADLAKAKKDGNPDELLARDQMLGQQRIAVKDMASTLASIPKTANMLANSNTLSDNEKQKVIDGLYSSVLPRLEAKTKMLDALKAKADEFHGRQ